MEQPPPDRPPIDVGAVLFEAVDMIGSRPGSVFAIALVTTLPGRFAELAAASYRPSTAEFAAIALFLAVTCLISLVAAVAGLFGEGALIGIVLAHHESAGRDFRKAMSAALLKLPLFAMLGFIYLVSVIVGIALLIVPGIILACILSVIGPVTAAEKTGPLATLRRSYELTSGTIWKIFVLLLVTQVGILLFLWASQHLLSLFMDGTLADPAYLLGPAPFLILTAIHVVAMAFHLALICSLYVALLDRDGGQPATRLAEIFE